MRNRWERCLIYIILVRMGKEFIIEMSSRYPFGELGETITQETSINVVKKLNFSSPEEYDMIQHMIHFLKAAKHENLVNVEKVLTN